MNTELSITQIRHQAWALQVKHQISSGLAISEWCAQNGIGLKTYQYHKRIVRKEMLAAAQPAFSEIPLQALSEHSTPVEPSDRPAITVTVSGMTVGINTGATRQLIADVLGVIRNA